MPKLPLSEKRLAANRANARKSTGPRTPEGKCRAARNNTRHGLYSREITLPEYWERLAFDLAQRAASDYLQDPGLARLVARRAYLRVHRSYAISLATRFHNQMFSSPDPRAYKQRHTPDLLAVLRYYGRIRRQIRTLDRSLFPALRAFHTQTTNHPKPQVLAASNVGQASRPAAGLQTGPTNYNHSNPPEPCRPAENHQATQSHPHPKTTTIRTHPPLPDRLPAVTLVTGRPAFPVTPRPISGHSAPHGLPQNPSKSFRINPTGPLPPLGTGLATQTPERCHYGCPETRRSAEKNHPQNHPRLGRCRDHPSHHLGPLPP